MKSRKSLNIVVIGTGMYVIGKGTDGYGTMMPAICEWRKQENDGEVYIVGANLDSIKNFKHKISELSKIMNINISPWYFPEKRGFSPRSYKEAIQKIPKPAVALIVVPDNLHREIAGAAIEAGLHTLVVKPLAPTLKEVIELIRIQKKNNVYAAVEFHKRLDYSNLKLKDIISEGKIGDPLYFLIEYSQRKSMPLKQFRKWINFTNVFQYLGIHYVDVIYFATGAIPKRALAIGQKEYLFSKGIDVYDSIEALIEWEMLSGRRFSSHILTNWVDPENTSAMSDQKIKVIGTKGRFESDQKNRGIRIVIDDKGIEEPNPYFCAKYGPKGAAYYRGYGIDSVHQFLNDVIQIEEGRIKIADLDDKRPTFKQSIVPTAVLEAVNKSLKNNGRWINIKI